MPEPKINIHLSATADTKVLKAATKEIKDQAHELKNSATNVAKAWADAGQKMSKVAKEHAKAVKALTPPGTASAPAAKKTPSRRGPTKTQAAATEYAAAPAVISDEVPSESPRASRGRRSTATKTAAAKKTAAAERTAAKKAAAKKVAAERAAAKKAAAKKVAAKKVAAKKAAAKRDTARKTAAKKVSAAKNKDKSQANQKSAGKQPKPDKKQEPKDAEPKTWWGRAKGQFTDHVKAKDLTSKSFIPDLSYGGLKGALPAQLGMLVSVMETGAKVVGRWIDGNEKLSKSFANLTSAGGAFTDSVLQEWLGEGDAVRGIMDKITTALGGQTEAMKEINRPLSKYRDCTADARTEQEKLNDELERQRDLLDEVRSALEDQLAVHEAKISTAETEAEIAAKTAHQAVDDSTDSDETKRARHHRIDTDLELKKYDLRKQRRVAEMEAQKLELAEREKSLKGADDAVATQQKRVDLADELQAANKQVALFEEMQKNKEMDIVGDAKDKRKWEDALARQKEAKQNAQGLGTADAERDKLDEMKQNATLQKEAVKDLQKNMKQKSLLLAEEQKQDNKQTESNLSDISREYDQKHQTGLIAGKRAPLVAPMEPVTLPPPPPPPPPAPATEVPPEKLTLGNEVTLAVRAAIRDAVNDGKGNTNAEMAVANQLQKSASATEAERAAALQQALQAMLRLQEGGSQMERQLTSVLSTYGSKLSQLASTLSEHEARLNNNDVINRR